MSDESCGFEPPGDEMELLQCCPFCGYHLRGLPLRHACPECGVEVDRSWDVFGPELSADGSAALIARVRGRIALIVVGGTLALVMFDRAAWRLELGPWVMVCVLGATLAFAIARRSKNSFVALGSAGVAVFEGRRRAHYLPWGAIARIRVVEHGLRCTVIPISTGSPVEVRPFLSSSHDELRRFVASLKRQLAALPPAQSVALELH